MAEKRKMFRKKRFKRFEDSVEKCLENDDRLQAVVSDVVLRERIWRRFQRTTDDDSDDNTDDNDFLGFDANSNRIQELLQQQWAERIRLLNVEKSTQKVGILRKARLEINNKTLQRIRTSHQTQLEPVSRSGQPGYITCAICQIRKYYSHVQRRYGVFSCEPCSKFFARFLKHPQQLFCARVGACSLSGKTGSGRCRACWLSACLKTFQMEEELRKEMSARFGPRVSPSSSSLTSLRVEIKNQKKEKPMRRGEELLMVANSNSGPRVKRVCRRTVQGLPVATFSALRDNCSSDSDEMPVDVYLCRAVAEKTFA